MFSGSALILSMNERLASIRAPAPICCRGENSAVVAGQQLRDVDDRSIVFLLVVGGNIERRDDRLNRGQRQRLLHGAFGIRA